jgi:hypothetical protein
VDSKVSLNDTEKRKLLILPRLELRPLRRQTRRQSLYRLSYRGFCEAAAGRCPASKPLVWENDAVRHQQLQLLRVLVPQGSVRSLDFGSLA